MRPQAYYTACAGYLTEAVIKTQNNIFPYLNMKKSLS
jgi:hypothetical protein